MGGLGVQAVAALGVETLFGCRRFAFSGVSGGGLETAVVRRGARSD